MSRAHQEGGDVAGKVDGGLIERRGGLEHGERGESLAMAGLDPPEPHVVRREPLSGERVPETYEAG